MYNENMMDERNFSTNVQKIFVKALDGQWACSFVLLPFAEIFCVQCFKPRIHSLCFVDSSVFFKSIVSCLCHYKLHVSLCTASPLSSNPRNYRHHLVAGV